MKLSYSISVCNEHIELEILLAQLYKYISKNIDNQFEIIIVKDANNSTIEVQKVIDKYNNLIGNVFIYEHSLNNDFSVHKNFINSKCTGDYIFNLDADEIPSSVLLTELPQIIKNNPEIDFWWVPRINIVKRISEGQLKEWKWHISSRGWINWPDWQGRIYLNKPEIQWVGKVHEHITGFNKAGQLPMDDTHCLLHVKDIEKQRKQNEFYAKI